MSKTQRINVYVWTITFETDDAAWATPIVGATRQQANDGTLAYLIDYLCDVYEYEEDPVPDWRSFTDVDEIVRRANHEDVCLRNIEIDREVHTINASDVEYEVTDA